ncbi:hypothetical protein OIE62_40705 [Streptomyces scopuliridis]|uniref:Uncharacterized protein n=1 Tax=Streptomyces scopuliridis TaxID=452529 RepID=A0ACD4ZCU5_9ACTN|nr:hypothetical protein [Streptomyces scopuliridis]WSB95616.1 hypothetical protein OG835_00215 [Streptomyces scopuliridis]WSC10675.1 hypothetical protein OIE62_40705 [Streptomyces scopuliridis]
MSGLLTIFRNVIESELANGSLELPVVADLGFSWRPDKKHFFPRGSADCAYPDWMSVSEAVPLGTGRAELMRELTEIRGAVAHADTLDDEARADLHRVVESLAGPYEEYFTRWFDEHDVDWVCAVNMTLSDAVPVTLGLHRAAARRWSAGVPGGVLFWDHDLFGSYAVFEEGTRVYPPGPNQFTPLPGTHPCQRWAVVSPALADEVKGYPTELGATMVPNVLPTLGPGEPQERHASFLEQRGLEPDRPLLLVPVRVFQVKGVEISVAMFAEMKRIREEQGTPTPYLLVFGSLNEDPPYAQKVASLVQELNVQDDVVFLDGVPLSSHQDGDGFWRLDEIDLLSLCRASGGAVLFTPNTTDVESVGLGPALAAIAEVPCAITEYACFEDIYGTQSSCVRVSGSTDIPVAATKLLDLMAKNHHGDPRVREALKRDKEQVLRSFDPKPWRKLFQEMANDISGSESNTKSGRAS